MGKSIISRSKYKVTTFYEWLVYTMACLWYSCCLVNTNGEVFTAVREFLARMTERFPAPTHLRHPEARQRALDDYAKSLLPFDAATLNRAWDRLVATRELWCWPAAGVITALCRACAPRDTSPSDQEQRRERAHVLANAYTARYFRTSHVAKEARREGWLPELRRYVEAAAQVQAQLLAGVRHVGFDSVLLDEATPVRSAQDAFDAYRATIASVLERGSIAVRVPRQRVKTWRARCSQATPHLG